MVQCIYLQKLMKNLAIDDLSLIEKLLEKGVAVAPGSGFGNTYTNYIRISTCKNEEKLDKGLDIINQIVDNYRINLYKIYMSE